MECYQYGMVYELYSGYKCTTEDIMATQRVATKLCTNKDFSHSNFLGSPYLVWEETWQDIATTPSQQGHSNNAPNSLRPLVETGIIQWLPQPNATTSSRVPRCSKYYILIYSIIVLYNDLICFLYTYTTLVYVYTFIRCIKRTRASNGKLSQGAATSPTSCQSASGEIQYHSFATVVL